MKSSERTTSHEHKHAAEISQTPRDDGLTRPDMSRRNFLKYAGLAAAGGAAGLALPRSAASKHWQHPVPDWLSKPDWKDRWFWKKVQKEFIIDPEIVYMNIGTTGSMPRRILDNYDYYNRLAAEHPRTFESELGATFGLPAQREKLAQQFGCNADEICLSRNTTDGLDAIIYGLELEAEDEILLTHHEHIAALSPLNVRQDRDTVRLTYVEIPVLETESADQFVQAFKNSRSPDTKAILFSHITYKTGTRLPAKELCQWASDNELISIVDGAHCPGMIELDFHDMGCDFYAGPGHKWQCGPGSTGILYLRNQGEDLPMFWNQNSSTYTFLAQPYDNVRGAYNIAYSLQYRGQLNIPAQLAMVDACDMWEEIGRDKIEAYVCGLSSYLKKALKAKFGDQGTFFAPDIPEFTSGLTSFNPFTDIEDGGKVGDFVSRLQDETGYQIRSTNFHLKNTDTVNTYACRISTHLFHNTRQIDGLVEAMYDLYLDMES